MNGYYNVGDAYLIAGEGDEINILKSIKPDGNSGYFDLCGLKSLHQARKVSKGTLENKKSQLRKELARLESIKA